MSNWKNAHAPHNTLQLLRKAWVYGVDAMTWSHSCPQHLGFSTSDLVSKAPTPAEPFLTQRWTGLTALTTLPFLTQRWTGLTSLTTLPFFTQRWTGLASLTTLPFLTQQWTGLASLTTLPFFTQLWTDLASLANSFLHTAKDWPNLLHQLFASHSTWWTLHISVIPVFFEPTNSHQVTAKSTHVSNLNCGVRHSMKVQCYLTRWQYIFCASSLCQW